jgi:hypothetical protein
MAETAMQQYHGRAGPLRGVPDAPAVPFEVALIICDRQRRRAVRLEPDEFVMARLHHKQSSRFIHDSHRRKE